jgi:prevent-host-death family protein
MKSGQNKPISYLKAHTAEIVRTLAEKGESMIITQNGEAKAVIQDIEIIIVNDFNKDTLSLTQLLLDGWAHS